MTDEERELYQLRKDVDYLLAQVQDLVWTLRTLDETTVKKGED